MRVIRFLLALLIMAIPAASFGQVGLAINIGPPPLPVYEQPDCPGDGYLWTPGYWAYDDSIADYYWVPGTWVEAPQEGYLWTPGYWGWGDSGYFFNDGYWGPTVGFYGGIDYGFGYWGGGYGGGRWDHGHFFYNTSVNNLRGGNFHDVYNEREDHGNNDNRVSFNGGKGGVEARADAQQQAAAREHHIPAVAAQTDHAQTARSNPEQRASVNHGKPAMAATASAAERMPGAARPPSETPKAEATQLGNAGHAAVHPNDLAPIARPAPVNSGNAKADQKYEQKQDQLIARQTQERQQLQQRQDAQHQQQPNTNQPKMEQKHQQQTQQLQQRNASQQQSLQSHQPQARSSGGGGRR
jgi:hypothetical protein